MTPRSAGLAFGIHPFSVVGMAHGLATGPPDDFSRLPPIIADLRGGREFLLRTYAGYSGDESAGGVLTLAQMFANTGEPWDFVLAFRSDRAELDGWLELIRTLVYQFGQSLHSLQITNEPNLTHVPDAGDGSNPHVRPALKQGVIAAKTAAIATGASIAVGFNAVPTFSPHDDFWPAIKEFGSEFSNALDYVGLDFYPDVFGSPIDLAHLPAAVEAVLRDFRARLTTAGISPTVPIRICENGWPTGPNRSYERQADVLEINIRTVHQLRNELNISHYELFSLRDADSANPTLFYQFGIMQSDYTPKPAFQVYKRLIQELSGDQKLAAVRQE